MADNTTRTADSVEIWQWNYRSFHKRAAALQSYIDAGIAQPDVICLQETGKEVVKLRDYYTIQNLTYSRIATLVHKSVASSVYHYSQCLTEHQLIEVHTSKRGKAKTFILNIYSPPKERQVNFIGMLKWALGNLEHKNRLVFAGYFNAPHASWGYRKNTKKGRELLEAIERYELQLETMPRGATRIGNSVGMGTYPGLTFTYNVKERSCKKPT